MSTRRGWSERSTSFLAALATIALVLAACTDEDDPTSTATMATTSAADATSEDLSTPASATSGPSGTPGTTRTPAPQRLPSTVWLVDATSAEPLTLVEDHANSVSAVRFTPDGDAVEVFRNGR
jgi:hypothetical protein